MFCGLSVPPGGNRQGCEVKLLPLLFKVHNRWILLSAALFVFRYCCLSNGAVLPLHTLLFISLRLHSFDHTPRKPLPFARGWFFTSISALQRVRLPLHVMTNPAEGRPLCARQKSTSCSRIELWWTNPHTYRSTSCWSPDECVVALGELVPGSNLSKTNDDTHTLANKAFTALSVLPNVSLQRCQFSFFLERFQFEIATQKPTYPKLFSWSSSEFPEELYNDIIKTDYDWPFPQDLQSIIFSQQDTRPSITHTAESSLLYNTTISHYFANSCTGSLHTLAHFQTHTHLFVHIHYVHTLHSLIPNYAYTHARTHTAIYNTNHALTFSRERKLPLDCIRNKWRFVRIYFPWACWCQGVTPGSDTCWPFSICGPGSSVGIEIELRAGRSGIESRWGRDFPPVQTSPGAHPACKLGTGSFPGVKCGRGVLLTTHPHLVPRSWKSGAIPLPTLWATPGL